MHTFSTNVFERCPFALTCFEFALAQAPHSHITTADISALRCPPCMKLRPQFSMLAAEFTDVIFVKVDVDKNKQAAREHNIEAMRKCLLICVCVHDARLAEAGHEHVRNGHSVNVDVVPG